MDIVRPMDCCDCVIFIIPAAKAAEDWAALVVVGKGTGRPVAA